MQEINNQKPIFFLSPVISRSIGLEKILPNFHIITISKDPIIQALRKNNVSVFCLEEVSNITVKNTFQLLNTTEVKDFIKTKSREEIPNILSFRSLPQIQHLCKINQYNYLQGDPFIVRGLEDKILFHKLLIENNIDIIPSQLKTLENCKFEGEKMVLQLRRGFAGNSSFIINNKDELSEFKKKYKKHQVKLSKYIEGITLTVNGFISNDKIKTGAFFIQIDNEPLLNSNILGTCGNSHFTSFISEDIKKRIYEMINNISLVIKEKGYRGFFGLDLRLSKNGNIYPIECNPRLTASIGNYTQMEIYKNKIPLLLHHIMFFMNDEIDIDKISQHEDLEYSFLICRNTNYSKTVKTHIKSGIYELNNKITFIREDIDFTSCKAEEYYVLPAEQDSIIETNKEYLYLLSKKNLFIEKNLSNDIKNIVKEFNKLIFKGE